jgi:outer membrane protein, adhesin transport system
MKRVLLLAMGLTLVCALASAQTQTPFTRALGAALASHPAVRGKQADIRAATAEMEGAKWARYPVPTLEASAPAAGDGMPGGLLRIDQPLWSGGRISAAIDNARRQVDVSGDALQETRWSLTQQLIAAYVEALRQQARQTHATAAIGEHEKLLAMIKRRVAQEVSPLVDQRFAESRLYQAQSDKALAIQSLNNARAQLVQLTGLADYELSWDGLGTEGAPASLEAAVQAALEASPTLRRLRNEAAIAEAAIDIRRSVYKPQLLLRLERQAGGSLVSDSRATLVLQAQPGSGLASLSAVEAAVAKRESALQAIEAAKTDLNTKLAVDWDDYIASQARLADSRLSSAMSAEVFDSYARQYVIGRKTWIDVLNAIREAVQAHYVLEDTHSQGVAAALRLRLACGTLLPE